MSCERAMTSTSFRLVVFASCFVLVLFLPEVSGLRCIKCTSLRDSGCEDGVGYEQHCNESQNFCVSYVGYIKKGQAQVMFRECAETNMSHFCGVHYEKLANNRVERVIACYRSCDTDFCNSHAMNYISEASPVVGFSFSKTATVFISVVAWALVRSVIGT
ncbi:uncharacterized protein [Macrobrachium rosenbergii]|uniref:uncharacterized protein n=1 Tax=Macrobrachium rosenbergii TaxID=79674 RepID=UPI0034D6DAB0